MRHRTLLQRMTDRTPRAVKLAAALATSVVLTAIVCAGAESTAIRVGAVLLGAWVAVEIATELRDELRS